MDRRVGGKRLSGDVWKVLEGEGFRWGEEGGSKGEIKKRK